MMRRCTVRCILLADKSASLRDSGSIEQDADVVMLLCRDEYYNGPKSEKPGIAEVIVAKQRNGPTSTVELLFPEVVDAIREPGSALRSCCE